MTGWLDRPLIALDCEATGTDPKNDRALSICLGRSQRPGDWRPETVWVVPDVPVPPESTAIHGLTEQVVRERANGERREDALGRAWEALRDAAVQGVPLVLFNAAYDMTLLRSEFRRELDSDLPQGLLVIDVLVTHRRLNRFTGSRRLEVLAAQNGIEFPAHDAEQDALATLRLLHILANENELLPLVSVHDLQPLQERWYAEQQEQAQAKALGNGTEFTPMPGWPVAA